MQDYLQHGYAVVGANVRGAGCSGGAFSLFATARGRGRCRARESPRRAAVEHGRRRHGRELVPRPHADPHRRTPAPVPQGAGRRRPDVEHLSRGVQAGRHHERQLRVALVVLRPAERIAHRRRVAHQDGRHAPATPIRSQQPPNNTFYDVRDHPMHDDFWNVRALDTYVEQVNVPMMIVQGWQDHQTALGGPRLFERLQVPKKMILQTGGHGVYRRSIVRAEVIRWMDRWLKGDQNGIDTEPAVSIWFEVQRHTGTTKGELDIDVHQLADPGNALADAVSHRRRTSRRRETCRATIDGRSALHVSFRYGAGGQQPAVRESARSDQGRSRYRSEPMPADLTIIGAPQVTFHVTSERDDTDFMVALHDISPTGDTLYLQRGLPARVDAGDRSGPFASSLSVSTVHESRAGRAGPGVRNPDVAAAGWTRIPQGSRAGADDHGSVANSLARLGADAGRSSRTQHRPPCGRIGRPA